MKTKAEIGVRPLHVEEPPGDGREPGTDSQATAGEPTPASTSSQPASLQVLRRYTLLFKPLGCGSLLPSPRKLIQQICSKQSQCKE